MFLSFRVSGTFVLFQIHLEVLSWPFNLDYYMRSWTLNHLYFCLESLPEVPGFWSDRKSKTIWNWKSKNIFLKSLWKLFRKLNSRFFIIQSRDGVRGLWSPISGNDVITGSVIRIRKFWMFFGVFGPILNLSLRSAELFSP